MRALTTDQVRTNRHGDPLVHRAVVCIWDDDNVRHVTATTDRGVRLFDLTANGLCWDDGQRAMVAIAVKYCEEMQYSATVEDRTNG